MSTKLIGISLFIVITGIVYGTFEFLRPAPLISLRGAKEVAGQNIAAQKPLAERIRDAEERSARVKGVYMTASVANDQGRPATALRNGILHLLETTELNGVVIDVKEAPGRQITSNLKPLLDQLQAKGIWTIARIVVFRDNSQTAAHPEYYFKRKNGEIWRDYKGNAWIDPASPDGRTYISNFSKEVADLGFDELQFDYVRFPSDGDMADIVYSSSSTPKYVVLKDFFQQLHDALKAYKPELILSADLFGYTAMAKHDLNIGQRLVDIGESFDYVSPMLYPSHFYAGFFVEADPTRNLPPLYYPYYAASSSAVVSSHPYEVVLRSLYRAGDILVGRLDSVATSTAITTPAVSITAHHAALRPFLQDFNLGVDTARGIYYDASYVRAEIQAAEEAGASGWLLWNASNVYTEATIRKKE